MQDPGRTVGDAGADPVPAGRIRQQSAHKWSDVELDRYFHCWDAEFDTGDLVAVTVEGQVHPSPTDQPADLIVFRGAVVDEHLYGTRAQVAGGDLPGAGEPVLG